MTKKEKIDQADGIVKELKEYIMYILWSTDIHEYTNLRFMIPLFGERSKYDLRELGLNEVDLERYFKKVDQVMGVYHEHFPCIKLKDDDDDWLN